MRAFRLDDYLLVSDELTTTVRRWSTGAVLRSIDTRLDYSTIATRLGDKPVLVAFDIQTTCFDVETGAVVWRRGGLDAAMDVVEIRRPDGARIAATTAEKRGGSRLMIELANGATVPLTVLQKPSGGRFFASPEHPEYYAVFDGKQMHVLRAADDTVLYSRDWHAHQADTTIEDGVPHTVRGDHPAKGLVLFGDGEITFVDTPDIVRCEAETGRELYRWTMPENMRVLDASLHAGMFHLLVQRWKKKAFQGEPKVDVIAIQKDAEPLEIAQDTKGFAIIEDRVVTRRALIPIDGKTKPTKLEELSPLVLKSTVGHPTPATRRREGWGDDFADPQRDKDSEALSAAVRRFLNVANPARDAQPAKLTAGPVAIEPALRRALVTLRKLSSATAEPSLSLGAIATVEATTGPLPPFIVAILASRVRYLENEWQLTVEKMAKTFVNAHAGLPPRLRAIGHDARRKRWLCIEGAGEDARFYEVDEATRVEYAKSFGPYDALEWISSEVAEARSRERRAALAKKGPNGPKPFVEPTDEEVEGFSPILIATAGGSASRVRHKKFGEGVIVGVQGAGEERKLTVKFDVGGERTLLAQFLEPV